MTAPAFVQIARNEDITGAGGFTASLGSSSVPRHLLVLAVFGGATDVISTPIGWTAEVIAEGPASINCYLFWKASAGETSVFVPTNDAFGTSHFRYAMVEYDLVDPEVETAHTSNPESPAPGFASGPSIAYGAGPRVVMGICFDQGGHDFGDTPGVTAPGTLRDVANTKKIYVSDDLIDAGAGTTSWAYINTGGYDCLSVAVTFAATPAAPEPGVIIDVYDPTDVFLATLPAKDVKIRKELDGVGSGSFKINRYAAEATAAILKPGNYVRVTIPQIDPDPIFGFFLETGDFKLVASAEKGGEDIGFEGHGTLSYWTRAIWLNESFLLPWAPAYIIAAHGAPPAGTRGAVRYAAGSYTRFTTDGVAITSRIPFTTGGFSSYYDQRIRVTYDAEGHKTTLIHLTTGGVAGWWVKPYGAGVSDYPKKSVYAFGPSILMSNLSAAAQPGEIIYAMYQEATAVDRPIAPIPLMTVDFGATLDSNGDAWTATDAANGVSSELGDDYLSTIGKLIALGVGDVEMGPDFDMHAYNALGRDLTGAAFGTGVVRFVKAYNIADELVREFTDPPIGTFAEVLGTNDGDVGRAILPTFADHPPREISVHGDSSDPTVLEGVGLSELASRLLHSDAVGFNVATPKIGQEDVDAGLYLPGPPGSARGNYWTGDYVRLHTGSGENDFNELEVRIAAITMWFGEAGDLRATAEVSSALGGLQILGYPASTGPTGSGMLGGGTPTSDLYQLISEIDHPNGYPSLDDDGLIAVVEIPDIYETTTNGGGDVIKAHGSMGATETFDPADGNVHTGTLNANCTVTLAQPVGVDEAALLGWFTQDGTGGWTLAFACAAGGTFTWDGTTPTLPTTLGTTFRIVFERVPGSTNDWVGILVGSGSSVAALDDLTDVVITSPTAADRLRYSGSAWVNSALRWEPHVAYDGTVVLDGNGDPVMVEVA